MESLDIRRGDGIRSSHHGLMDNSIHGMESDRDRVRMSSLFWDRFWYVFFLSSCLVGCGIITYILLWGWP